MITTVRVQSLPITEPRLDQAYLGLLRAACRGDALSLAVACSVAETAEILSGERARLLSRKANIVGACRREVSINHISP